MKFRVAEARIDTNVREALEVRGAETIRAVLIEDSFVLETAGGERFTLGDHEKSVLLWLKEQADKAERRETWLIIMEIAITVFVGLELIFSAINFIHGCSK
jgi:hypothetical protein